MGRRSKADLYGIVDYIIHLYFDEKKDIRTIANILKAEGYQISKSSIHRTIKSYADAAEEFKRIYEETKVLVDTLKENPASDVMEGITAILANRIFKFVKDIDAFEFDDPHELIHSVQRLSQAIERLEKYRAEKVKKVIEEAKKKSTTKEDIIKLLEEIYGA